MIKGVVIKSTGSWYTVKPDGNDPVIACNLKGKLRLKDSKTTNPVAVGDVVDFEPSTVKGEGVISHIYPRKNYIIRRSIKLSKQYHVLAANIDQAVIMASVEEPFTPLEFIDRFLATCEAYEVPPVLIINKIDRISDDSRHKLEEIKFIYEPIGYSIFFLSLITRENLDQISKILHNKCSLIAGNSGVGKSTLLNILNPSLKLKTANISAYHKTGKHTTTFAERVTIDNNTFVIDTPGIKGFGVIDMEKEEIYHFFPEIFKAASGCRFHNCLHINEPGCAVKEALDQGKIHPQRFRSYVNMLFDGDEKYRII